MSLSVTTKGAGPDLVLLHGWGMNAGVWDGLPPRITADRRCSRIELPGHGQSPFMLRHDSLAAWAEACLAVAPARAVWLGWSLGGLVVLQAALQAPLTALILMTATPRFVRAPDWPAAMDAELLVRFHDTLVGDPEETLNRFLTLQLMGGEGARGVIKTLRQEVAGRPPPNPAALEMGLDLLRETDLRERLHDIACPTLWLFGQRDSLVPAAASDAVGRLLPTARRRVIAGAAHAPFLSHPLATGDAIDTFLREVS